MIPLQILARFDKLFSIVLRESFWILSAEEIFVLHDIVSDESFVFIG